MSWLYSDKPVGDSSPGWRQQGTGRARKVRIRANRFDLGPDLGAVGFAQSRPSLVMEFPGTMQVLLVKLARHRHRRGRPVGEGRGGLLASGDVPGHQQEQLADGVRGVDVPTGGDAAVDNAVEIGRAAVGDGPRRVARTAVIAALVQDLERNLVDHGHDAASLYQNRFSGAKSVFPDGSETVQDNSPRSSSGSPLREQGFATGLAF